MKFLRLNRTRGRTNLINLDNVADIYVDDNAVSIEFIGQETNLQFGRKQHPQEYKALKHFFEDNLEADDVNIMARR